MEKTDALIDQLLRRGVAEIIDEKNVKNRLQAGQKLRVKLGIDVNKPDMHIGHAVPLRKLREFQDAGHQVILIVGDYTAQLGDPTDRQAARTLVSAAETQENAKHVLRQIFLILDESKTEVRHNSEWFGKFTMRNVIELMANSTVNQLLSHETFQKRLDAQLPLFTHELLYPLLQGYDSVIVKADLELGGLDQKFNTLMGRVMQRAYGQQEQDVMLFPYLPGIDGSPKMSKSLGNTVNLNDTPNDMYGKVMSIPDELILRYFELATTLPAGAVANIASELSSSQTNPRDLKMQLACEITALYHGLTKAQAAEVSFVNRFQKGQIPVDVKEKKMAVSYKTTILMLLDTGLVVSGAQARRLIEQGGVRLNGKRLDDQLAPVKLKKGTIIQIGKQRLLKVK